MGSRRRYVCGALLSVLSIGASALAQEAAPSIQGELSSEIGRAIYEKGRLPTGEPIAARSAAGQTLRGEAAACIVCHRKSGMGMYEGSSLVPPISGPALFEGAQPRRSVRHQTGNGTFIDHAFLRRSNYDETSLARAIREGINPNDEALAPLMPRYTLSDAQMSSVIAYLKQLSATPSPGIDAQGPHFATVIAPGVSADDRQTVIDTLNACFVERFPAEVEGQSRWKLHVWDLDGAPETWPQQLAAYQARQPVFGLVSGLGGSEWQPVHDFCSEQHLPCLYPNVDVPGAGMKEDTYNFYFSAGVLLEAGVATRYLGSLGDRSFNRVVVVHGETGPGVQASQHLRRLLSTTSLKLEERTLKNGEVNAELLADLTPNDVAIIWLAAQDLNSLTADPPKAGLILVSGFMAGFEDAPLTPAWKQASEMIYAIDAPLRRTNRMRLNLHPWIERYAIKGTNEMLIGNTLTACNLLSEGMARMRGYNFRDYLVEWTETYPPAMGNAPAPQAFPRFETGIGQRFSSRGAYIARFSATDPKAMELVRDWLIP